MTENTQSFDIKSLDGKGALWTIAGTSIAIAASKFLNGGLNKLINGGCGCGDNCTANAVSGALALEVAKKDSEIALLKADKYTDQKLVEVYKDLRGVDKEQSAVIGNLASRVAAIETAAPLREQILCSKIGEVATMASNGINCLSAQVSNLAATVANITKCVVPITAVCPQPMAQYNAWVAPTGPTA